jgi:tRNA modification GTPase
LSLYASNSTIAAEATPQGRGGISVIRISGSRAVELAGILFDRELPESGRFRYGKLIDPGDRQIIDDAVISHFDAGHSYTGEEVIEISTHGSPVVIAEVLSLLYREGAIPAAPGEFTLRAFLNGRLDLTQAEAVADMIDATSLRAARLAARQLTGSIGVAASGIEVLIEKLLIACELELDFSEDDVELLSFESKLYLVSHAIEETELLLQGYETARKIRSGLKVVITGSPNVGKSSIFNRLLRDSRAIVHHTAGTTRDVISARTSFNGVAVELFDTAGIREGGNEIEDEGIRRARKAIDSADLVIAVDSVDLPGSFAVNPDIPMLRVRNKADLGDIIPDGVLSVSCLTGQGIDDIMLHINNILKLSDDKETGLINRERHFNAVTSALTALKDGRQALNAGYPGEMLAEHWRAALAAFGELTGKRRLDNLLTTIFSEFCIGK